MFENFSDGSWEIKSQFPQKYNLNKQRCSWEHLDRNLRCEVIKYLSEEIDEFEHTFEVQFERIVAPSDSHRLILTLWQLRNQGSRITIYAQQVPNTNDVWTFVFYLNENGSNVWVYSKGIKYDIRKKYYVTVKRNTKGFRFASFSDPERTNLIEESDWCSDTKQKYNVIAVCRGISPTYDKDDWSTGYIQNLDTFPSLVSEKKDLDLEGGLFSYFLSDKWTNSDLLGYEKYAYAIYNFIIDKETRPPLTISIQAPWGGGKTTLMKKLFSYFNKENGEKRGVENHLRFWKLLSLTNENKLYSELKKDVKKEYVPIWLNAWKYEHSEQLWAGLATTIISQFADYLPLNKKELFYFQLHTNRINFSKYRKCIYNYFFNSLLFGIKIASIFFIMGIFVYTVPLFSVLYNITNNPLFLDYLGSSSVILCVLSGIIHMILNLKKPVIIDFNEYVSIPEYSNKVGFIHYAERDLRTIFNLIGKQSYLIIFIDDLDRCSPNSIANVVEGLNLFLSGDFDNCYFIIGMDTEMVAAALDEAHSSVLTHVPDDSTSVTVGWRFMDKFVQLPFCIPPPEKISVSSYIHSLLGERNNAHNESDNTITPIDDELDDLNFEINQIIDDQIARYNQPNSKLRDIVSSYAANKFTNPREIKRFINLFRFTHLLSVSQKRQNLTQPTENQLLRWVEFSIKWPEVARWVRRERGFDIVDEPHKSRLKFLEETSNNMTYHTDWKKEIISEYYLDEKKNKWVNDKTLWQFFKDNDSNELLSTLERCGLW